MRDSIEIRRPDDWHLHVRDGGVLASVLRFTAERFARAIIMPNLQPPVVDTPLALAYRERILEALPTGSPFEPLMVLYLTDRTTADEIERAKASGCIHGVKLYPAGATTHSDAGVTRLEATYPALEAMAEVGLPLLVHGEVTDPEVDVFDREAVFIDRILAPLCERFAGLRVVLEHITTAHAVDFVRGGRDGIAATVTPQHITLNRNALFSGGLRPHNYCLPVLKAERHRMAVAEAATSGDWRFFLGTDSAPHARAAKESECGCAGIFSAPAGVELYVEAFEAAGRLDRFEAFASINGPRYYGLAPNEERITLVREPWKLPDHYRLGEAETIVPMGAGGEVAWRIA